MIKVDPLVILMFGRMRRCQNDQHVDCKCQKIILIDFVRGSKRTFSAPNLHRRSTRVTYVLPYNDAPSLHRIGSVDYRCQKGVRMLILYVEPMGHFRPLICSATKHVLPTFYLITMLRVCSESAPSTAGAKKVQNR